MLLRWQLTALIKVGRGNSTAARRWAEVMVRGGGGRGGEVPNLLRGFVCIVIFVCIVVDSFNVIMS